MNQIRVLTVAGPPFERGFAHGQAYADEIALLTEERLRLSSDPLWTGHTVTHREIMALGRACLDYHQAFAPDLMLELRGLAEATRLGLVELLIMNGFTDFVDVVFNGLNDDPGGCTAFVVSPAATADGRGYLGQTWDMHTTATPHVLLLDVQPAAGPALLSFTITGCLGMIGLNEHGLAVGINNLMARDGRPGVTWPFVVRRMLAQTTVEAALAVLRQAPLAGAHNYLLLGPDGRGVNVEALSTRHQVTPVETFFVHTNHCLAPELVELERDRSQVSLASTTTRLDQARRYLQARLGQITPETLMALTRYRQGDGFSVCAYPLPNYAIESSGACLMSPASRELWAVWGLPDQNPYERFVVTAAQPEASFQAHH